MGNAQNFPEELLHRMRLYSKGLPSPKQTHEFVDNIFHFLFPLCNHEDVKVAHLHCEWEQLRCLFAEVLSSLNPMLGESSEVLSQRFFDAIPSIHEQLLEEVDYFVQCDPAAKSKEEVLLCYPGFYAMAVYRLANELYRMKIPVLPRAISEYAHSKTGIDIHPGATIGKKVYIDHGTGIVIGETTVIGNNVKIYQGVTLGALYVEKNLQNTKRHPSIEDDVIIYAGSTILGGDTVVGRNTIIGGNVWLTESVAPNSIVYHNAEVVIRDQKS